MYGIELLEFAGEVRPGMGRGAANLLFFSVTKLFWPFSLPRLVFLPPVRPISALLCRGQQAEKGEEKLNYTAEKR